MKNRAFDHSKYQHWIDPNEVTEYKNNAKIHTEKQIKNICTSIRRFGWQQDTVLTTDNVLVIGHGRRLAALKLGCEMPYHVIDKTADELTDEDIRELRIADNQTNAETGLDFDMLNVEVADLEFDGFDFDFCLDPDGGVDAESEIVAEEHAKLTDKFLVPPFSVLDARQGYWKERKKAWRDRIGDVGQARKNAAAYTASLITEKYGISSNNTTSILDPVLSELVCRWFIPGNGDVFDCFAGDTVFGYVAASLGNRFTGIELRAEQAEFNAKMTEGLCAEYICDDGRNIAQHIKEGTQDLFFSCPPYYDLEQYSDLPDDASNQETYGDFYQIIDKAFAESIKCLKQNRFAVIVCGDVRDKKTGAYYDFPGDIKRTFISNGMALYNELILVDPVGTAAIRANNNMLARKVVKVHQNVLVFYKGDTKKISKVFPEIEVSNGSENMEF